MTVVFVLRHPQTTWNVAERYQGRLEAPLSVEGQRQCREAVRTFQGGPLAAVYSSPLKRALELGRGIAEATSAPLVIDHRLTEMAQGPWEGLYRAEIRARFPKLAQQWYERPDTVRFPGGESLEDVLARSQSVLADVFARYPAGNVFIVTHAVVIQVMSALALGLDLRYLHRITISNASVTTLSGEQTPGKLESLNATRGLFGSRFADADGSTDAKTTLRRIAS